MAQYLNILYLFAAILFILGIKGLTRIKTAGRGNLLSAMGMLVAVIATLLKMQLGDEALGILAGQIGWSYIIAGVVVGGLIGAILAKTIKMTAMPQFVALFNGFGGGASVMVALSYSVAKILSGTPIGSFDMLTVILSLIIGSVTFTGSLVAFGKLQGFISGKPILFPGNKLLNLALALAVIAGSSYVLLGIVIPAKLVLYLIGITVVTLLMGILLVTPIGGADMPVVISLLNSYSGLAASATGFVLKNDLLIISGALVGASGLILTRIMCKAMNRSLANVLFGGFGADDFAVSGEKGKQEYTNVKEASPEEAALTLEGANSVIIIPGYGLAVAQAQFAAQELAEALEKRGSKVSFAIHPVAGRMPGHMNVLLAEAKVPYEKLYELDTINPEFKTTDVVIIAGANDVVNPAAAKEKGSPIYGMPILNAYEAKTVFVIKRSLSPGFAGIKNALFEYDNTQLIYGDGKKVLQQLINELKEL
ncbi:TPA: NAD(P)(+) transhydrogenase (Re/Si-specific) subunit beta [Candidatus Woesearchaeota archaeon]|nr:NAD(P)(+) transhydrogenase (Re/Si-specific) subunit beta [Candidatus Woesearchaeota archaeon]HII69574.1 NAD(P)(+) transhydrogenase (Re/Si-specific) subunit beta [Candidatus Woesearchaeota archaeon]